MASNKQQWQVMSNTGKLQATVASYEQQWQVINNSGKLILTERLNYGPSRIKTDIDYYNRIKRQVKDR